MPESTSRSIFISFPVANVPRTAAFYQALGFTPLTEMTGDDAAEPA